MFSFTVKAFPQEAQFFSTGYVFSNTSWSTSTNNNTVPYFEVQFYESLVFLLGGPLKRPLLRGSNFRPPIVIENQNLLYCHHRHI